MESERPVAAGTSRIRRLAVSALLVLAAGAWPAVAGAQGLPSSDELQSDSSEESSSEEESSTDDQDTSAESEPASSDESSDETADSDDGSSGPEDGSLPSPSEAEQASEEDEAGDSSSDDGETPPAEEDEGDQMAGDSSDESSEQDGDAESDERAERSDGETDQKEKAATEAEEGAKEEQKDKAKRGKVVATDEEVTKEVEGRGAVEGDPRWVQSGVNARGVPGFQHMTAATPNRRNTYNVSFFGAITSGENMIRAGDTNTFLGGQLNVHAQILKYFSANVSLDATNNVNNFGRPQAMLSQGDLSVGLRGHYLFREFLDVGADVTVDFPTGFGAAGYNFAGTSVRPRILATLDVDPLVDSLTLPLTAHLNVGYRFDNTQNTVPDNIRLTRVERFAYDISAYDMVQIGIGASYQLPYVSPFLAWNLEIPVNGPSGICGRVGLDCVQNFGFEAYPDTISLGLRGEPVDQLSLHAGVDLSLTSQQAAGIPATPPYELFVGASWKIDPRPRVERTTKKITKTRRFRPKRGYLAGTVVDKKSGDPVSGAQITYAGKSRSPQMAGSSDGTFRSYGFEPGSELEVQVSHPKYHDKKFTVKLEKGEREETFELKPKPQKGTVTGTVVGQENGEPIAGATVRLAGPELKEVQTDESGKFRAKVKAGKYGVGATSDDHLGANKTIDLPAGKSKSVEFKLEEGGQPSIVNVKEDKVEVDQKIRFEFGTAKLSRNSDVILDQVASTLKSHPELTQIEIAGHTDNVGTKEKNMELSRNRAKSVYDYLVDKGGVDASRLVSKGYGPTEPLVPNISDENRQLNRRVEFKILQRRETDQEAESAEGEQQGDSESGESDSELPSPDAAGDDG